MGFDIDVLIVHAETDNETKTKGDLGWVSQFKKFLELMLHQVLGERLNIIIKSDFDNLTAPKLEGVGVLVTVLSQEFVQSKGCLDNVDMFRQTVSAKDKARIFKVFKTPLTIAEQPERLRELIGYEMYQLDPDSGEIREYADYFSNEAERQYWMKMVDLAYDIYDTVLSQKYGDKRPEVALHKRKTIYLAETGHDLSVQRNIIKRELLRHGYSVLPKNTLAGKADDLERGVNSDLERCNVSIHLIGSAYGDIPEGSEKSVVDIQNRLAAERALRAREKKEEFSRLIWVSPNLSQAGERQKSFIETIKRDVEAQEGAEILQTSLEDFKNIMREELMDAREKFTASDSSGRSIYLMHDRVDHSEVKPIVDMLERSGFKVLMPEFEGELLELRQKHIENLRNLDGAIIYKGKVNEQWVRMKALDLLKAPGFGRKKPIMAKAIMAASGSGFNTESFKSQNMRVIEGDQSRSIESLKSFLQEFSTSR